jgi:hypothetical protein
MTMPKTIVLLHLFSAASAEDLKHQREKATRPEYL